MTNQPKEQVEVPEAKRWKLWVCECGYYSTQAGKCRSHPFPCRAMGPDMGDPIEVVPAAALAYLKQAVEERVRERLVSDEVVTIAEVEYESHRRSVLNAMKCALHAAVEAALADREEDKERGDCIVPDCDCGLFYPYGQNVVTGDGSGDPLPEFSTEAREGGPLSQPHNTEEEK